MKREQQKAMFARFKPKNVLNLKDGTKLLNEHQRLFGTDDLVDYNSRGTSNPNVEFIFSKDQPRFNQMTGEKIKRFPELGFFLKVKGK